MAPGLWWHTCSPLAKCSIKVSHECRGISMFEGRTLLCVNLRIQENPQKKCVLNRKVVAANSGREKIRPGKDSCKTVNVSLTVWQVAQSCCLMTSSRATFSSRDSENWVNMFHFQRRMVL